MEKKRRKPIIPRSKADFTVYIILRLFVILTLINQAIQGNYENVFMCILTLVLFTIPLIVDRKFNIELPNVLESIIFLFIFSAQILRRGSGFLWDI